MVRLDEFIQQPGQKELLLKASVSESIHVAVPGKIVSYDNDSRTAQVLPLIRVKDSTDDPPILTDVPVFFPGAFSYEVAVGDECLVIFADGCIDSWFENGGVSNPQSARKHDMSDGFAFIGFHSKANPGGGIVVKAPTAADSGKFLSSNGTWQKPDVVTYSDMTGATETEPGTHGLAPAPPAGAQVKYLRGDGTWAVPDNTTYSDMVGATAEAAGSHGLVPAPEAGKQNSVLTGSGTWASLSDLINALDVGTSPLTADDYIVTQYAGGGTTNTTYYRRKASAIINGTLVKAALGTDATHNNTFLRKDGTWAHDDTKLNISGGTMTGQLLTSFNSAVAMGSYQVSATTLANILGELRFSSGCSGSFNLTTAYSPIPVGWYNFMYAPHRSGGVNGSASGDNCNYGSMLITAMNHDGGKSFIVNYNNGGITVLPIITSTSDCVKTSGDQTIGGLKKFTTRPIIDFTGTNGAKATPYTAFTVQMKNAAGSATYTYNPIRVLGTDGTDGYNSGVLLGSDNGTTIVGAGESSSAMPAKLGAYNDENLYLIADGQVKIYTNCANDASSYGGPVTISGTTITGNLTGNVTGNCSGTSSGVLDSGNSTKTTFAYSKAGMNYADYTWLAAWNGYELRGVNKNQFAQASHSHSYLPLSGGTMTGNVYFSNIVTTTTTGTTPRGIYGQIGDNDGWRIVGYGASNAGCLELATGDDGNEPIYVRQYSGGGNWNGYVTIARTATLLDASGNTSFPGTVTASGFSGPHTGHSSSDLALSGGTMTGNITLGAALNVQKAGQAVNWIKGRDSAIAKITSYSGYNAVTSMKTTNGSWETGVYTSNVLYWTYCPDNKYNANDNTGYVQMYLNSSGYLYAPRVYNAVWNDYAEFRKGTVVDGGYCMAESSDGKMRPTHRRMMPGCKMTSDTYGSSMGETKEAKTPIAVAGRVLARPYPKRKRKKFKLGALVCSAPDGTVDVMSRLEAILHPECIVGTVSEIPDYDVWRGGCDGAPNDIEINGRIWIYVR